MLLNDLAQLLADNGVGTLEEDLFRSRIPPEPDECVAVLEYPGEPPVFMHDPVGEANYERPRFQVLVRSRSYQTARATAETIWALLSSVVNQTLGSTLYMRVIPLQSPFVLRRDENERVEVACNFTAWKSPG